MSTNMSDVFSDIERGICPVKKQIYYGTVDPMVEHHVVDTELIKCDSECPGAEAQEVKLFRFIPFGSVGVCPMESHNNNTLQTP